MLCLSCMHEQSCRRGGHASPRVFSIVLCTGANAVPVHIPPLMRRVSHRIQSSGGGWPYPPPSVWSGPVMSGLVWSQKMLITHIWQNFIHRIPLDSL